MKKYILLFILLLFIFSIDIFAAVSGIGGSQNDLLRNVLFGLGQLVAIAGGVYALRKFGRSAVSEKLLGLISSGLFLWFIGSSIFTYYDAVSSTPPFPSIADVFVLVGYPMIFLGLLLEMRAGKVMLSRSVKILFAMLVVLLSVVVIYFEIFLAYDPSLGLLANATQACYGIADLVLIISCLFVLILAIDYRGGKMFLPWLAIFLGVSVQLVADILFGIYITEYIEKSGINIVIDLIWRFGYVFFAFGLFSVGMIIEDIQSSIRQKLPKISSNIS